MGNYTYSGGWGGGTSASTSSSYYYTKEFTPQHATILETKQPGSTWADVVKVSWNGAIFVRETIICIKGNADYRGRILRFEPLQAIVSFPDKYDPVSVDYSNLRNVADHAPKMHLDPNMAFKHRKKNGRY